MNRQLAIEGIDEADITTDKPYDVNEAAQDCNCCECNTPLHFSDNVYLCAVNRKPTWQRPRAEAALFSEAFEPSAVAFLCDACSRHDPPFEPRYVVEFVDGDPSRVRYHLAAAMEEIEP